MEAGCAVVAEPEELIPDAMKQAAAPGGSRKRHIGVRLLGAMVATLLLLAFLLVSTEPLVETQPVPSAQAVDGARQFIAQLKAGTSSGAATRIRVDNVALAGLSTLASDGSGLRINSQINAGWLRAQVSWPLPLGLWVNGSAALTGTHAGFPEVTAKIGSLPIPAWLGRGFAEVGRWLLRMRGARIPPLDKIVRGVAIAPDHATALLQLPGRSGIVRSLAGLNGGKADPVLTASLYCDLSRQQQLAPSNDFATHIRRLFAPASAEADAVRYNRAAFVALALFVVGERAYDLAPTEILRQIEGCSRLERTIRLAEREDLAKHWAMSAALAAVLGDNAGRAIGEWKELADSLPRGSGFSFIDLAADRSGIRSARLGLQPGTARQTAARLGGAEEADLLPIALLAAREGLTEREFVARYGRVDQVRYRKAVATIDRALEDAAAQR